MTHVGLNVPNASAHALLITGTAAWDCRDFAQVAVRNVAGGSETMTSATEKLRRLLDERGVEWKAPNSACADLQTFFKVGRWYVTADSLWYDKERIAIRMSDTLTPEQAIAATLGSGMCKNVDILANIGFFKCSECGISDNYVPNYCPNCGAKVLENKK